MNLPIEPTFQELADFLVDIDFRLFLKDDEGRIVWGSPAFLATVPDAIGQLTDDLFDPDASTVYRDSDRVTLEQGHERRIEPYRTHGHDESVLTWKQRLDRNGQTFILGGFIDLSKLIGERNQSLAELHYRATHDDLTGLLNRGTFYALLDNACRQRVPAFALLYLDLNGFKQINDTQGHLAGDDLLKAVAEALQASTREGDAIARMGGDEFAILLPSAGTVEAAVVCDRIAQAIREAGISSACGIAVHSDGDGADDVIARADRAMYAAKRQRETCRVDQLGTCAVPVDLIQELDQALERGELVPHYQPIAASHNRRILGYELLCRWPGPDGMRSPAEFLPIAEEAGWMPRLDWLMIQRACQELEHFEGQFLSVNVSGATLQQSGFRDKLASLLAGFFVSPDQIKLEISESIAIGSTNDAVDTILLELGQLADEIQSVKLYVDDYGAAHAQLMALMQLCQRVPTVKALKLDAALVSGLENDPVKLTICRNTIDLAHGLGLEAIAEGVETQAEALTLCGLRCDQLQGWLIGKPLPIEEYMP